MEEKLTILSGRLDGRQRNKLKGLFDMYYSPRELAEEIGINKDQFYMVYIPLGCPHERDTRNHILINGIDFLSWYCVTYKKIKLQKNESFCKTCKKAVKISKQKIIQNGQTTYILSKCPNCGRCLTKIISNSRGKID
jgi:uncharacterized protein with PIN domain